MFERSAVLLVLGVVVGCWQMVTVAAFAHLGNDAWGRRDLMPSFSLGPAPFPHPSQNAYELFGSAFAQNDAIKVTDDQQHQKGAIWSKKALQVSEFQIDLVFRVGGGGKGADQHGDGFAFWYTTDRGVGGQMALGGPDVWNGLGVFFDTYKNKEFRGKKHPYVYAIVNKDHELDYRKLRSKDIEHGCHIPFRNKDPAILDTTVARITYKDKVLSVIMQPEGAVDWVKCAVIENVDLPLGGFFGVSAMTGELVDRHHMILIKGYTNIEMDPLSYAEPYEITQMPDMWTDMRHSGEVAREYTEQEKKILEDTDFDPVDDDYEYNSEDDDYYNDEDYEDNEDEDDEEEDEEDDAKSTQKDHPKSRKQQEIRDKRKQTEKKAAGKYSRAELQSISEIIEGTEIGDWFKKTQEEHKEKIQKLRQHLESDLTQTANKLTALVREIRIKEHHINKRIQKLADKLHIEVVQPFEEEHLNSGRSWVWPFIFFLILIVGIAFLGYTRYKSFMKSHLL